MVFIEIVIVVDGDYLFMGCGIGFKECFEMELCLLYNKFKFFRNEIKKMMEEVIIGGMVKKYKKGNGFLRKV